MSKVHLADTVSTAVTGEASDVARAGFTVDAPLFVWQPIETAPQERPVWLVSKDGGIWIGEHCYEGDGWLWGNCYMAVYQRGDGSWASSDCQVDDDYQPTHWMELPMRPIQLQGEASLSPTEESK
jgi:hypothetical protein